MTPLAPAERAAFSLLEMLLASVIAFVGAGVYVALNVYQARQDVGIDARLAATDEARMALETLMTVPFEQLAPSPAPIAISSLPRPAAQGGGPAENLFRHLRQARLTYHVRPYQGLAGAPPGRAMEIEVTAHWSEEETARSLRLVTVRSDASRFVSP